MRGLLFSAVILAVSSPALAEPTAGADPFGARSISADRYDSIAKKLETSYRRGNRSVEVLLNLAAIRLKQRDAQGAEALYREVLAQPNVDMQMLNGNAWSHDIASRAMSMALAAK